MGNLEFLVVFLPWILQIVQIVALVLIVLNFPKIVYTLGKAWARGVKDGNDQSNHP